MFNPITYGTLTITSEELIKIRMNASVKINEVDTFNLYTITNPGNVSPFVWQIDTKIRKNSTTKFLAWCDEIQLRPMKNLTIFARTYQDIYLTGLDITASEIAPNGDLLWFDMNLRFTQNVNFGV